MVFNARKDNFLTNTAFLIALGRMLKCEGDMFIMPKEKLTIWYSTLPCLVLLPHQPWSSARTWTFCAPHVIYTFARQASCLPVRWKDQKVQRVGHQTAETPPWFWRLRAATLCSCCQWFWHHIRIFWHRQRNLSEKTPIFKRQARIFCTKGNWWVSSLLQGCVFNW